MKAMQRGNRRSALRVVGGRVQKKNNWDRSFDYYSAPDPRLIVIDRKRPGVGYRHVLSKKDIHRFLELLPDWNELAVGLNAIVLAPGDCDADGYHAPGVVHICAWEASLWRESTSEYYLDHRDIFERLGVTCEEVSSGDYLLKFDEAAIRGYQLLHILLHELGHHHDRMSTRWKHRASRAESYA